MKKLDQIIILSLATWRLASLLVQEDGPFDVFGKLRHAAGVRYDERSVAYGTNPVAQALTCIWCASVWAALGMCLVNRLPHGHWFVKWMAASAGAVIIHEATEAITKGR